MSIQRSLMCRLLPLRLYTEATFPQVQSTSLPLTTIPMVQGTLILALIVVCFTLWTRTHAKLIPKLFYVPLLDEMAVSSGPPSTPLTIYSSLSNSVVGCAAIMKHENRSFSEGAPTVSGAKDQLRASDS